MFIIGLDFFVGFGFGFEYTKGEWIGEDADWFFVVDLGFFRVIIEKTIS